MSEVQGAPGPLKKVPKWAWIASGGIVMGVGVMRWRSNKGATTDTGQATATGDYGQTGQSFPSNGVVSAPASAGDAGYGGYGDGGSSVDLPSLIDSVGNIFASGAAAVQPVDLTPITDAIHNLPGYAGGGGAPSSSATTDTSNAGTATVPTAVAPKPEPTATGWGHEGAFGTSKTPAPVVTHRKMTKDNGKSGKDKRVWCVIQTLNDGHVVSEDFQHNGACK